MTPTTAADLPAATRLAVDRTRLAHERTLMAWIRTAASLISFGFTIYKFFQYLHEGKPPPIHTGSIGPRGFGLMMIFLGIGSLAVAIIENRREMLALRAEYGAAIVPYSLATLTAAFVAALGVFFLWIVWYGQ